MFVDLDLFYLVINFYNDLFFNDKVEFNSFYGCVGNLIEKKYFKDFKDIFICIENV